MLKPIDSRPHRPNLPPLGGRVRRLSRRLGLDLAPFLVAAILGCGEDPVSPAPPEPGSVLEATSTVPLSFIQVSAGSSHTCGVTSTNLAYCWGSGHLGTSTTSQSLTPVAVAGGLHFLRVSAGNAHTCGITTTNRAYCWGDNQDAQLGDGTTTSRVTPTAVAGTRSFRQISAGPTHTCGVTTSDIAFCWGSNEFGKLGAGLTTFQQLKPVRVAGGLLFRQVIAAGLHACGSTTDNRGYCWGANNGGQLGNGTRTGSSRPVAVAGGRQFRMLVAGGGIVLIPSEEKEGGFSCGLTTGDLAYCWGDGPLGNSTTNTSSTPLAVAGGRHFRGVNLSHHHVCAVTNSDVAFCWGANGFGQLGDGTLTGRAVPVRVTGGLLFKSVTANTFSNHSCGVTTANRAYCWGSGGSGQLGSGTAPYQQRTPLAVAGVM